MATEEMAEGLGLEGVVVARTRLSDVDGERGRLIIAGHDVEDLAGKRSFEEVCSLLWGAVEARHGGGTPSTTDLGAMRVRAFSTVAAMGDALAAADGMDGLRASLAHLRADDVRPEEQLAYVTAATTVFAACWSRVSQGYEPIAPDPDLSTAADYLRMISSEPPARATAHALDTYLVTVSDHGLNASTFTARVIASTGSDVVSAVVGALAALKGPLHGGAPGPVLDMLDAIGEPDRAAAWVDAELAQGRRIMGMGHRVYRVRDPRARVFEAAIQELHEAGVKVSRLELARAVERVATSSLASRYPARALAANVEFYTAVLLDAIGLHRSLFTPTFAVGRVAGWCAHVAEQRARGRLIRPLSRYVGETPAETAHPSAPRS